MSQGKNTLFQEDGSVQGQQQQKWFCPQQKRFDVAFHCEEVAKILVKLDVFRSDIKSLLEIKQFQESGKLIITKDPFYRFLNKLMMDLFLEMGREATR